jgi:fructose-1,6-bisphosphatase class II
VTPEERDNQDAELEQHLALEFVRVVERAAVASARTMGRGDGEASDHAAVQAMRQAFNDIDIDGRIVIGEGERDRAPMLFIGERIGATPPPGVVYPRVDVAVDPLEGTNLCATGMPNALAVLAAAEPGGLLHAPDCYMEKLIAGAACRGALDLNAPVRDNLRTIARCLERRVEDLTIIVLDRPRHQTLIDEIRAAGARIRLISDGDLSAGISAAVRGAGVHAVMGSGGAPEGVITAAAMRCLHGEMVARLIVDRPELEERVAAMGIKDPHRVYTARDLAPGRRIIFAACGITEGPLLKGVQFFGGGARTHSLVMTAASRQVRFIDTVQLDGPPGPRGIRLY